MARTTIDIEDPILRDLKALQKREGKSLGKLISELLAEVLNQRQRTERAESPRFRWNEAPMDALVNLEDKDAVWRALDEAEPGG